MGGLTFIKPNEAPFAFENAGGQLTLAVDVELPDVLSLSLQAGGSVETPLSPEEDDEDDDDYYEDIAAMLNTEYLTFAPDQLPGKGFGCLDGYHLTYDGAGDVSSESPALLYHHGHLGVIKLDLRLAHVGAGAYRCTLDATNELGHRLHGACDVKFRHLSIRGQTLVDDQTFDTLADRIMGTDGTRRRVTQPMGGTNEQYFLFLDMPE